MSKASLANAAVALVGLSLLAIGLFAVAAPEAAAAMFGVPAQAAETRAYVWAAGIRDLSIGCWLLMLIALRVSRRVSGASLLVTALIPLGDVIIVSVTAGTRSLASLALHSAGVVLSIALGMWLLVSGDEK